MPNRSGSTPMSETSSGTLRGALLLQAEVRLHRINPGTGVLCEGTVTIDRLSWEGAE